MPGEGGDSRADGTGREDGHAGRIVAMVDAGWKLLPLHTIKSLKSPTKD